ncbi:MAG: glycoside hydrolase family 3 C-terminal domain-containing protein, partial [Acetobacteraceae bacterium]
TLVEGHGVRNAEIFHVPPIARLCLPAIGMEDGPAGVGDMLAGATQLPAPVALAATWDPGLARRYGAVIGAEDRTKGVSIALGPTINIDRDPRWGRSFESLSEDPYLTARMATAEIEGIQGEGVISEPKHFAVYNQETNRNTPLDDAIVAARTLHEIYLPAFRAAVRSAHAGAMMCAYSTVNGAPSCDNGYLLTGVLRREWNFPGFVTSDYEAIHATSAALAGADQEQPFPTWFGTPLFRAVRQGRISRAVLNTMVARILTELCRFGLVSNPPPGRISAVATTDAHVRLAQSVAEAGTVLLKNDDDVLPLARDAGGTIAVIGPGALVSPSDAGGGSAFVAPTFPISPLAGIFREAGRKRPVVYAEGLPAGAELRPIPASVLSRPYRGRDPGGAYSATLTAPETGTFIVGVTNPCDCYTPAMLRLGGREILSNPGTPPRATYEAAVTMRAGETYQLRLTGPSSRLIWATPEDIAPYLAHAGEVARQSAVAIVVLSDHTESEAADRPNLALPSAEDELVQTVAAANPRTVVVIDAGAPVAMPWLGRVAAILDAWYPGQMNGAALAAVLFGEVDPGGHLPMTFPNNMDQLPTAGAARFPGLGGKVSYAEGLEVGYRWYDANGVAPLFPFGFGLSYTHFAFSDLRIAPQPLNGVQPVAVSAMVTNTGPRAGSDVVQLYLGLPTGTGEPPRRLVGFRRVALRAGQAQEVRFVIEPRQTWWWGGDGWDQTAGTYRVDVGDSSATAGLPLSGAFRMENAIGGRRVVVGVPGPFHSGKTGTVEVMLTVGGDETLHDVSLALEAPEGWKVVPAGPVSEASVLPKTGVSARFNVTPPKWAFAEDVILYAQAKMGAARRSAGAEAQVLP